MATLGGLEIFIDPEGEQAERTSTVTSHPVESGANITDNVRRNGTVLNLTGEIVGPDALRKLQKIAAWKDSGTIVPYSGVYSYSRMQITHFNTVHSSKISGGYKFDACLQEVRIAKSACSVTAASARKSAGTQRKTSTSTSTKVYYRVKSGDTLWALLQKSGAPYKNYGFSPNDVMRLNPNAFSRRMNPRTLQIGANLWIGNRK